MFRCTSAYLLQLLLLAVAVLLNDAVEFLSLHTRHVSLGCHPSSLLGGPGLSQVPVGCCHVLTGCLLLLPPLTLVSFGVPTGNPTIYSVHLKAVHSFVWCIYRERITGNSFICLVYLQAKHLFVPITESRVFPRVRHIVALCTRS